MNRDVEGLELAASSSASTDTATTLDRKGLAYGIAAYTAWGLVPLFWRELRHVNPVEVLAHRTLWGLVAFFLISVPLRVLPSVRDTLRDFRSLRVLAATGTLLAINWGLFIYAVSAARVLEASLGYFINPLVSVLLGVLVLGERLRRLQAIAMLCALTGVVQLALKAAGFPWIALVLAASFGLYGLLRKTAKVEAVAGSLVETLFMAPVGGLYLAYLALRGESAFLHLGLRTDLLLVSTGVITAFPLIWFTVAARRLPLARWAFCNICRPRGSS